MTGEGGWVYFEAALDAAAREEWLQMVDQLNRSIAAAQADESDGPDVLDCRALRAEGLLMLGRLGEAEADLRQAQISYAERLDTDGVKRCLIALARTATAGGDHRAAVDHYRQVLTWPPETRPVDTPDELDVISGSGAARSLLVLGEVAITQGSPDLASEDFLAAAELAQAAGDEEAQAAAFAGSAGAFELIGEYPRAEAAAAQADELFTRLQDSRWVVARTMRARLLARREPAKAERALTELSTSAELAGHDLASTVFLLLGTLAGQRGATTSATMLFDRAVKLAGRDEWTAMTARACRGLLEYRAGDPDEARRELSLAVDSAQSLQDPYVATVCGLALAGLELAAGRLSAARDRFSSLDPWLSTVARGSGGGPHDLLAVAAELTNARICSAEGRLDGARQAYRRAHRGFMARDMGSLAAWTAVSWGALEFGAGNMLAALDLLVPAALSLDAARLRLKSARQRQSWSEQAGRAMELAMVTADRIGDRVLLAELIETIRGSGLPVPDVGRQIEPIDALEMLLASAIGLPEEPPAAGGSTGRPLATAAILQLGSTSLDLPPLIRTPWAAIALGRYLGDAEMYGGPVRARVIVDLRVPTLPGPSSR